jgi:actin-like ATPase involved in cell morphogenesis
LGYFIGIDLGTTFTAAAVRRGDRTEIVTLGNRAAAIPSVILLRQDETILAGEAADRRAFTEPDRVAREFKRRVGDPTPLILGGVPYSAEALASKLLRWTVDQVAEREGGLPDAIVLTHPANWGPYKKDLLAQAIRLADLDGVVTLTEPEAAATYYASQERLDVGDVIAVYDLGGGTFDACVLRKEPRGFTILGQPEGIERLGGIDFDQAVFTHVARALGGALEQLDPSDPAAVAAVARLRQESIEAKEALSGDTDASIPVLLPTVRTEVRLTRDEFESMVRPAIAETIEALRRALRSAGVETELVRAVLLVGGSSRIPLVAKMVSAALGRPVAVDAHPKYAVCMGAAMAAEAEAEAETTAVAAAPDQTAVAEPEPEPAPAPARVAMGETVALPAPVRTKQSSVASKILRVAVPVAAALVIGAFLLLRGGGPPSHPSASTTPTGSQPTPSEGPSATSPPASAGLTGWARVPADPAVFGGPGQQSMTRVIAGGPGLIAVGSSSNGGDQDAAVWTSADGDHWARVPDDPAIFGGAGEQNMNSVVAVGSTVIAVGWDGSAGQGLDAAAWTSTDGLAWTRVKSAAFGGSGDQVMNKAVAVGSAIIGVGYDTEAGDAAVWLSDGTSWTRVSGQPDLGGAGSQRMRAVTAGGPGLVGVGFESNGGEVDAAVWTSPNGTDWTRERDGALAGPGEQSMSSVIQGGPGLVAAGTADRGQQTDAAVWTSADGVAWSKVSNRSVFGGLPSQEVRYLAPAGSLLVAVGTVVPGDDPDAAVWTSPDGTAWHRVDDAPADFGGGGVQTMWGAVAFDGRLIAVGWSGPAGSFDAQVWTARLP